MNDFANGALNSQAMPLTNYGQVNGSLTGPQKEKGVALEMRAIQEAVEIQDKAIQELIQRLQTILPPPTPEPPSKGCVSQEMPAQSELCSSLRGKRNRIHSNTAAIQRLCDLIDL